MKVKIKRVPDPRENVIPIKQLISNIPFGLINSNTTGTVDDSITTTLNPVDKDKSNMEAEKGEILLRPDLSGLYKVGGKKHSEGGTPLVADPGSFVFSNDRHLAITDKEKEAFNFKKGGTKKKDNTPAKVLSREIDVKEYNRLISIMEDPKADKISKETAALMLGKFQDKIGQIAFLQEAKKHFPTGIPDFSTMPEQQPETEIDQQDMFKKGGVYDYGGPEPSYTIDLTKLQKGIKAPKVQAPDAMHALGDVTTGKIDPIASLPWQGMKVPMNSLEKLSIVTPGIEALTAKRYYDMLSQKTSPDIRLDRVNNAQEVNDVKEMATLATKEQFANSPAGIAQQLAANIRANALKGISQSNSNADRANTQIGNQESMINHQSRQQDELYNLANVKDTYRNNQLTDQRAGEYRRAGFNQSLNNAEYIQTNLDAISQAATTTALPYISNAKDSRGNELAVKGRDGEQYKVQGAPFTLNANRMPQFNPMFGSLESLGVQLAGQRGSEPNIQILSKLMEAANSGDTAGVEAYSRALYSLNKSTDRGSSPLENIVQSLQNIRR